MDWDRIMYERPDPVMQFAYQNEATIPTCIIGFLCWAMGWRVWLEPSFGLKDLSYLRWEQPTTDGRP